jgi:phosphopantothenoylcysteine decarboxylase/phosphopantothenate--cysteine ligase
VTLVTTAALPVAPTVKVVSVETAREMLAAVESIDTDIAIMAAAVADFRPAAPSDTKLARSEGLDRVELVPNPDILASIVARKERPYVVGFAAETGDVGRAVEKARRKEVDLLVYNDVSEPGSGFGTETNRVTIVDRDGATEPWPILNKGEVAVRLLDRVMEDRATRG